MLFLSSQYTLEFLEGIDAISRARHIVHVGRHGNASFVRQFGHNNIQRVLKATAIGCYREARQLDIYGGILCKRVNY